MAESDDNKGGRMLFTDFDVSDKGRPTSVVEPEPEPFLAYPLHTITDLASSLDLDFEDDIDVPPRARSESDTGSREQASRERSTTRFILSEEDQELDLEEEGAALDRHTAIRPLPPPVMTWEDYARAFSRSQDNQPAPAKEAETDPPAPAASEEESASESDASALERTDQENSAEQALSDFLDTLSPAMSGSDESGLDVLSFLDTLTADSTEAGVLPPPREKPYGGVERVENWYETPEEPARPDRTDGADAMSTDEWNATDTATGLFSHIDLDQVWNEKLHSGSRSPGSETGPFDAFADLDLDSLWESRVHASNPSAGDDGAGSSETIIMKSPDQEGSGDSPQKPAAAETTVMTPDTFYTRETRRIVLDPEKRKKKDRKLKVKPEEIDLLADLETFLDASEEEELSDEAEDAASLPPPEDARESWTPPEPEEDDDEELDINMVPEGGRHLLDGVRKNAGEFDLDDMDFAFPDDLDDSGVRDVSAPEISTKDIQSVRRKKKRPAEDDEEPEAPKKPRAKKEKPEEDEPGENGSRKAKGDAGPEDDDYSSLLDELAGDDEAVATAGTADDVAAEADYSATGGGLTTDDLLGNLDDFGDDSINADVSAPVVDNADIDIPSRRPRPGTEEMQALMGEGEFAEDEGGAGGEGGEGEDAGPAADEVAVNPMDVFANMDDMDFSDDIDEDMRAMMEDEEGEEGALNIDVDGFTEPGETAEPVEEVKPEGGLPLVKYHVARVVRRVLPMRHIDKIKAMIAWQENWWFYCDLLAAIIASGSLAVIISYYLWYRN